MIPREQNQVDSFYVAVLKTALRKGALSATDRVLVVCGGAKDEESLSAAGLLNIEVSNIGGHLSADVENLPYADDSYDAVIVHSGLHHCASPHRGLLEMHRVARRCVILLEPADNLATRFGKWLGIGQTYEFAAVHDNRLACGGWRNTSVPNWVYRFTAHEIRQTICCAAPFGPHRFTFRYRTRMPWGQLRQRPKKLPLILVAAAAPVLRLLDVLGPVTSNNLAATIVKPKLPDQKFPWVVFRDGEWSADRAWFAENMTSGDSFDR